MLENLPTFFTSNFDFKQLEHHLTYTQRGEAEEMKAARIMERIKYLAKPIPIGGKNRRHSKRKLRSLLFYIVIFSFQNMRSKYSGCPELPIVGDNLYEPPVI